jgi:hypothetical protein
LRLRRRLKSRQQAWRIETKAALCEQSPNEPSNGCFGQLAFGNAVREGDNLGPIAQARQRRYKVKGLSMRYGMVSLLQQAADAPRQQLELLFVHVFSSGVRAGARFAGRPWENRIREA